MFRSSEYFSWNLELAGLKHHIPAENLRLSEKEFI